MLTEQTGVLSGRKRLCTATQIGLVLLLETQSVERLSWQRWRTARNICAKFISSVIEPEHYLKIESYYISAYLWLQSLEVTPKGTQPGVPSDVASLTENPSRKTA